MGLGADPGPDGEVGGRSTRRGVRLAGVGATPTGGGGTAERVDHLGQGVEVDPDPDRSVTPHIGIVGAAGPVRGEIAAAVVELQIQAGGLAGAGLVGPAHRGDVDTAAVVPVPD